MIPQLTFLFRTTHRHVQPDEVFWWKAYSYPALSNNLAFPLLGAFSTTLYTRSKLWDWIVSGGESEIDDSLQSSAMGMVVLLSFNEVPTVCAGSGPWSRVESYCSCCISDAAVSLLEQLCLCKNISFYGLRKMTDYVVIKVNSQNITRI